MQPEVGLEQGPFGHHASFDEPPQRDQQLPRQGHDPDLAQPLAPVTEASLVPLGQLALGLEAQPRPGQLDGHGSDVAIAVLADPALPLRLAALMRGRGEPGQRAHLLAVAKVPPSEELRAEQPGAVRAVRADRAQGVELAGLARRDASGLPEPPAALRLEFRIRCVRNATWA